MSKTGDQKTPERPRHAEMERATKQQMVRVRKRFWALAEKVAGGDPLSAIDPAELEDVLDRLGLDRETLLSMVQALRNFLLQRRQAAALPQSESRLRSLASRIEKIGAKAESADEELGDLQREFAAASRAVREGQRAVHDHSRAWFQLLLPADARTFEALDQEARQLRAEESRWLKSRFDARRGARRTLPSVSDARLAQIRERLREIAEEEDLIASGYPSG